MMSIIMRIISGSMNKQKGILFHCCSSYPYHNAVPDQPSSTNMPAVAACNTYRYYCEKRTPKHGIREQAAQVMPTKTTVTILNDEVTDLLQIDKYSPMGFVLNNGVRIVGPIAIFPKGILSWRVGASEHITAESLSLFALLEPKLDIVVLGIGDAGSPIATEAIQYLTSKNIGVEVLSTDMACATFNFLNMERRYVAGAIIPPSRLVGEAGDEYDSVYAPAQQVMKPSTDKTLQEWDEFRFLTTRDSILRKVDIRRPGAGPGRDRIRGSAQPDADRDSGDGEPDKGK